MDVPNSFLCPITRELIHDPVIAADGFSYERDAIQKWFTVGRKTSPVTNEALSTHQLFPNRALKNAIQDFVVQQRQSLRDALLSSIKCLQTKKEHDLDDPLVQMSTTTNVVTKSFDTVAILQGILVAWETDLEMCLAAFGKIVELMDETDDSKGFDVVIKSIHRFEDEPSFQALSLQYIAKYAQSHHFARSVSLQRYRACDVVTSAMNIHYQIPDVQCQGAKAIQVLAKNFPSNVFKAGVSKALLKAISLFPDHPSVVIAVCQAIMSLSIGTLSRLCHAGFCRCIAESMTMFPNNIDLLHASCLALGKVGHSRLFCSEQVCDAVVQSMNHEQVAFAACTAISKLAFWTRFASRIGQSGGCFEVVSFFHKALMDDDPDQACIAGQALQMLVCEDPHNRSLLAVPKTAEALVKALISFHEHRRITAATLHTMVSIGSESSPFTSMIKGEVPKIIKAMRWHLDDTDLQEAGWELLDLLAVSPSDILGAL